MRLFLLLQRVYILMFPFLCLYNYRMGKRKQDKGKGGGPSVKVGKRLGQGSRVTSQTKYVLQNMKNFFDVEKTEKRAILRNRVHDRMAQASGLSTRTIFNVLRSVTPDNTFLTPTKRYERTRIRVNPDSFDKAALRQIVHSFYNRREYPTLTGVWREAKEKGVFSAGRFCLWRCLKEMGFVYKKRDTKRYIYEQKNIIEQRHAYLYKIREYRHENRPIIYTDETWVNAHHTKDYIWVDCDGKGGWKVPSGKGQRLIVLHAGGVEGWVEGADLVFKSKTNSADYHDEMNNQHFMEWLTQQLLPNIPPNSVIVLDNATYHNKLKDKPPTTANKRDDIKDWLRQHGIHFEDHEIKRTLLEKVRQNRPEPLYLTDEAARDKGHTVLHLPVAHCELNPIELAWASVKGYVARHNKKYNMTEIQRLTPEGFTHTTTDMWRGFCRHVVDVENDYFEKDGLVEDLVDEFVVEFGEDDDCGSDDEEELMDDEDRRLIDIAIRQTTTDTVTPTPTICTDPRRDLTSILENLDPDFCESVLPLS